MRTEQILVHLKEIAGKIQSSFDFNPEEATGMVAWALDDLNKLIREMEK